MPVFRSRSSQDALERARDVSEFLANVGDLGLVPGLKAAAQLSKQIIDVALAVQTNQEDAVEIAGRIGELMMAMISAKRGKTEEDVDTSFKDNLVRFGRDLEKIRLIMTRQSNLRLFRRIWGFRQHQKEITDCKEKIDHAFKVFQVYSAINIGEQMKELRDKLPNVLEDVNQNLADIEEIHRGSIDLCHPTEHEDVRHGKHDGKVVVVKTYKDEASWLFDIQAFRGNWQPYFPQLRGRSIRAAAPLFVVIRDPGTPMPAYVQEQLGKNCKNPRIALVKIVNMIKQISEVTFLADRQSDCKIDIADIHVRPEGCPVLVNFYPNKFFSGNPVGEHDTWDSFLRLIAKSVTGDPRQPNYTVGRYGVTGELATRMSRFLLHFLWDFKSIHSQGSEIEHSGNGSAISVFRKFSAALKIIEKDIETAAEDDDNPLLSSLRKQFASGLCGIWDVWEPLYAKPGDIGVLRGSDLKRPMFHRFTNVADQISEVFWKRRDMIYVPDSDPPLWSTDPVDGMIRHTLRVKDSSPSSKVFAFSRGWEVSKLDKGWDTSAAWAYIRDNRPYLEELAKEHDVNIYDLCLVFSYSKSQPYTQLTLKFDTSIERDAMLQNAGFENGMIYYFENPSAHEGHVQGYWSTTCSPDQPLWPLSSDAPGPSWAWEYSDDKFEIENSRKGPVEHIRYLSL